VGFFFEIRWSGGGGACKDGESISGTRREPSIVGYSLNRGCELPAKETITVLSYSSTLTRGTISIHHEKKKKHHISCLGARMRTPIQSRKSPGRNERPGGLEKLEHTPRSRNCVKTSNAGGLALPIEVNGGGSKRKSGFKTKRRSSRQRESLTPGVKVPKLPALEKNTGGTLGTRREETLNKRRLG